MDPEELEVGEEYMTNGKVEVCFYEEEDCKSTLPIDLTIGTLLTFVGPDKEDGYVFENAVGTRYCLHDDDLAAIEIAA